MKTGKLNNNEKYAIQGMLHDEQDVQSIAKSLDRTEKIVQSYIDNELDKIHDTVATVQADKIKDLQKKIEEQEKLIKQSKKQSKNKDSLNVIKQKVYERINQIPGLAQGTGLELVKLALKDRKDIKNLDEETLFGLAMQKLNAKHLMIRETGAKKSKTVAIMTKAASEKGDDFYKNMPDSTSRTARNNLYDIQKDAIIDQ